MATISYGIPQQLTSVRLVSDVNLSGIYFNGPLNNGIGATLTDNFPNNVLTVDGVIAEIGDRILLSDQTDSIQNGIYVVNSLASLSSPWVLKRSPDFQSLEQLKSGQYFSVDAGDTLAGNMYVLTEPLPTEIGSSGISFINVTTGGSGTGSQFLRISNNLSDVQNKQDSFSNLGLGSGEAILLTDSDFIGGEYHLTNPCPNYISIACNTAGNTIFLPSANVNDDGSFALSQGPFIRVLASFEDISVKTFTGLPLVTADSPSFVHFISTDNSTDDGSWAFFTYLNALNGISGLAQLIAGANMSITNNNDGSLTLNALSGPSAVTSGQENFYIINTIPVATTFSGSSVPTSIKVDNFFTLYQNNFNITMSSGTPNVQFLTTATRRCLINAVFTLRTSSVNTQTFAIHLTVINGVTTTTTAPITTVTLSPTISGGPQEISLTYNLGLTGPGDNIQFWISNLSTPADPIVIIQGAVTILDTTQFGGFSSTDVLPQGVNNLYLSQDGGTTYKNLSGSAVVGHYASFNSTGGQLIDSGIPFGGASTVLTNSTSNNATYYLGFFPANSSTQQVPQVSANLIANPFLGYISANKVSISTTASNANLTVAGAGGVSGPNSVVSYFGSVGAATAANFYSIMISKEPTEALLLGINKDTLTNNIPANSAYISTYSTNGNLSFGRGTGTGLPNDFDMLIGAAGNITMANNLTINGLSASSLVSTDGSKRLTSSVSGLSPTFTGLTLSGLSINSLIGSNGSSSLVSGNLSGDITTNAFVSTLATVNSNVGSFGSATQVGTFTVNAKGLITAASNVTISGIAPTGAAGGDLSGTYPNPTVAKINTVPVASSTVSDGQILIGSTSGANYLASTISGTANQVVVTNASHSITLSLPQAIASGSSPTFTGLTLSGLTSGSVLFAGASGVISQNNSNFFWDNSANSLNIGTTITSAPLTVQGSGGSTGPTSLIASFQSPGSPTAGNLFGIQINKIGTEVALIGINKNTTTGNNIPADSVYISTYKTNGIISIGRGAGNGLPTNSDFQIDGSGQIFMPGQGGGGNLTALSLGSSAGSISGTTNVLSFSSNYGAGNYISLGTGGRKIGVTSGGNHFITSGLQYNVTSSSYLYQNSGTQAGSAIELTTAGGFSFRTAPSGTNGNSASVTDFFTISNTGVINASQLTANSLVATNGSKDLISQINYGIFAIVTVTASAQSTVLGTRYFNNYTGGQCAYALPGSTGSGKSIEIISLNTASTSGFKATAGAGDKIQFGSSLSAANGNVASTSGSSTDALTLIDAAVGLWVVYPALGANFIVT